MDPGPQGVRADVKGMTVLYALCGELIPLRYLLQPPSVKALSPALLQREGFYNRNESIHDLYSLLIVFSLTNATIDV
jgi:hypothetical protein